jgi:hypothetical protein
MPFQQHVRVCRDKSIYTARYASEESMVGGNCHTILYNIAARLSMGRIDTTRLAKQNETYLPLEVNFMVLKDMTCKC